jgi:two-component system phosphate regulon sensor histidine kinase PhoR
VTARRAVVRSRLFWRVFAGFLTVVLATTLLLAVAEDRTVALLAGVALALVLALLLARRLMRPVRALATAAAAIAAGEAPRRVPFGSRDEFGGLADAFNRMAEELEDRIQTITRERRELRAILAGMVEGVVAVNSSEQVVILNAAAARMVKADAATAVGRGIWEATRVPEVGEALTAAVRKGEAQQREARLPGTPRDRFISLHAAPLKDTHGAVHGAVLVLYDITEIRTLEGVRRDFVANVSHELKTPLSAIRGFVETILEDADMEAATRERFLGRVLEQVLRLSTMVEELLALSRLESAPGDLPVEVIDACRSVRRTVLAAAPLAREREIRLTGDLPPEEVVVRGSEEALQRIAGNLVDNALKYTPRGGHVTVRLRRQEGSVLLEVEDSGPGIPPHARERVFERFFRVDAGRSRAAGGTGLGLSIVKHLVQALDGEVSVGEAPSGGSLFRVRLPAAGQG